MQRFVTLLALGLLMASPAFAQQLDRTSGDAADVVWARDIGSATITLDGTLSEPEWAQAESINIKWDAPLGFPGSGQFFETNTNGFVTPPDPIDATVSFLRKGNDLYIAVNAKDESVGGTGNLWTFDGLIMTLINRNNRAADFTAIDNYFGSTRAEFFYSWWTRAGDTTATGAPLPGLGPYARTPFGAGYDTSTTVNRDLFDYSHSVSGVSNDDMNGGSAVTPDAGYILEFKVAVDTLGWDLNQTMARMPITIALEDADSNWPRDPSLFNVTRAWWQGQWGNTLSEGVGYIAADPSVTVSSGAVPAYTEPEFTVTNANRLPSPVIDGRLDESAWTDTDPQFSLKYKATPAELDAGLPGVLSPYYSFYYHPDQNPVLDPTEGRITMFYRGSMLYLGLDTDDNAINGIDGESGRDGFRLIIRSRDSTSAVYEYQAAHMRFDFSIDSTGAVRFNTVPDGVEVGTDLMGAVFLKPNLDGTGTSTVADPSDIDGGYQMEIALDLTSIGYPADLNGEQIWVSFNYFDGDALENDAESYSTRTWSMGERTNGASIMGYLDPATDLASGSEGTPGAADGLRVLGSYPNPTMGTATVRYALARAATVTVEVFDVLGRRVQTVQTGLQVAGAQTATVDASALSAGAYIYRVRLDDGTSVTGRMLVTR